MKIILRVDPYEQWFASLLVTMHGRTTEVGFKIDTGCNSLVLSHSTLKRLGIPTDAAILGKLPDENVRLASGEKSPFKRLGAVSLHHVGARTLHICDALAICHATRKTNDLMGTAVFRQFTGIHFHFAAEKYMELAKPTT
jgi:hypothetical protein